MISLPQVMFQVFDLLHGRWQQWLSSDRMGLFFHDGASGPAILVGKHADVYKMITIPSREWEEQTWKNVKGVPWPDGGHLALSTLPQIKIRQA